MAQSTQTAARPDRGITPNGAYSVSDLENISLQNGNLNLSIPLASLPTIAGGKLSWTISASYNSKLWDVIRQEQYGAGQGSGCQPIYTVDTSQASDRGGWRVGGSYAIYFRDAHDDVDYRYSSQTCEPTPQDYNLLTGYRWYKVTLNTPDGAEHELRPTDYQSGYDGSREYLHNYYKDTPESINQPMRYYSFDGSYLSAVINPTNSADPVRWTLYMPDGTTIVQYKNGIQRVRDTNANSIKIFTETDSSGNIVTHYQDEGTGREIRHVVIASASYSQRQEQVQYQTVGGTWESIDINFGTTNVHGKLYETDSWNPAEESTCRVTAEIGGGMGELPVIREIVYPVTEPGVSAKQYTFSYNSDTNEAQAVSSQVRWACGVPAETYTRTVSRGMGELSRMVTPSGATAEYAYQYDSTHDFSLMGADALAKDKITSKALTHDGTTDTWTYDINADFGSSMVTNPDGSFQRETFYSFNPAFAFSLAGANGKGGLTYRSSSSDKVLTERHWMLMPFSGANEYSAGSTGQKVGFNAVVDAEYTSLVENGVSVKMSARTYQRDYNGNVEQTTEYDWFDPSLVSRDALGVPTGVPSSATVLRVTTSSYYNAATSSTSGNVYAKRSLSTGTPLILSAPQQTSVGSSITQFSYDGQAYGTAPTVGNLTTLSKWDNVTNSWLAAATTYDAYGNVATITDPRGKVTQVFYEDSTHALPTRVVVDPQNGTGQQSSYSTLDYSTGAVLSRTDANGQVLTVDYTNQLLGTVDPFGRPGAAYSPAVIVNGTSQRHKTTTTYLDSQRQVIVASDLNAEGDGLLKSRTTADQLGRPVIAEQSEDGSSNYVISSQTVYEQMGKITYQSNPHRSTIALTDGWTRSTKDVLGRVTEVATFSGSTRPAYDTACDVTHNCMGRVVSSYDSNQTTVEDQAGKTRRSVVNALGQLVRVDEPDSSGNLELSNGTPAQPTSYTYDTLGNLTQVSQGIQTRTFSYSSLSRLTSATNPESGTISYQYDANGNLTQKTDARGVTATYAYDALNRAVSRTYSDSTPAVTYTYDASTVTNSKGRLTSVSSSVSATSYSGYDAVGKIIGSSQTTDNQSYSMTYGYNLSGALTTETYPSGRIVTTSYDNAGRLSSVTGQKSEEANKTYVSQISYAASGPMTELKLGNNLWEHTSFNSRLQPIEIGLGTTQSGIDRLKLSYFYGTTNNNGNVQSQSITVPGGPTLSQSYTYDSLNRLKSAEEMSGGSQSWKQSFIYDRYGNRTFDANNTSTGMVSSGLSIDQVNNRFTSGQGSILYDNAGNLTRDFNGHTFTYDGENKQVAYDNGATVSGGANYFYDGDGRRVKKVNGGSLDTTIFVYDAMGQMIAEYSSNIQQQSGGTSYLTSDNLGTPRVITGADGSVKARHDYAPFGEELFAGVGGRTTSQGYVVDLARQKFAGSEHDVETGLDFMQARYYSNMQGRFTSVDPLMASAQASNPQTWNRYTYALNNPLNYVDPTGLDPDKYWLYDGYKYYSVNQDQRDSMLQETYDDGSHVYTEVPTGTNIGVLTSVGGPTDFYLQNNQLEGEEVILGGDGNFQPAHPGIDCAYCEDFFPAMQQQADAIQPWMKAGLIYMSLFTGPVSEAGGFTSLGIEAAEDTLILGRGPELRLLQLGNQEGGRISTIESNIPKEIFKQSYKDMRTADRIFFYQEGVPTTLEESLQMGGGQFSRAELYMIRSRADLLFKARFK
jgi:RHS repeat-associated protein